MIAKVTSRRGVAWIMLLIIIIVIIVIFLLFQASWLPWKPAFSLRHVGTIRFPDGFVGRHEFVINADAPLHKGDYEIVVTPEAASSGQTFIDYDPFVQSHTIQVVYQSGAVLTKGGHGIEKGSPSAIRWALGGRIGTQGGSKVRLEIVKVD